MQRLFDVAIAGGMAGGFIAGVLWIIDKARGKPPEELEPEKPTPPSVMPPAMERRVAMSRDEMVLRLRAMAADTNLSLDEREAARKRLRVFETLEPPPAHEKKDRERSWRVKMPRKHWLIGAALLVAWSGFNWLRYGLADARLWDCYEYVRRATQQSICIRDAIGDRDSVITWAIGLPLGLAMVAFAALWLLKQARAKPDSA